MEQKNTGSLICNQKLSVLSAVRDVAQTKLRINYTFCPSLCISQLTLFAIIFYAEMCINSTDLKARDTPQSKKNQMIMGPKILTF